MIKPKRLEPGDTIGIVSPATASENKSDLERCVLWLTEHGFKVVVGSHVNKTNGFTAASESERALDINEMFARDDVDAVFSTQGGYGSAQLFRHLDFATISRNPKIFTGFSDITSLHLMLGKFCSMVTFHSPGIARFNSQELTPYTQQQYLNALTLTDPLGTIPLADPRKWLVSLGEGTAEGRLLGGNMTLLCASMGTPYEPDLTDAILLLEEVDTEPWIMDHMFSHLRNCGVLDRVAGLVIGECKDCVPNKYNPGFLSDITVEDILEYYLAPLGIPVLYGLPLGHTKDMATLPLGIRGRIDSKGKTLEVLEGGVI